MTLEGNGEKVTLETAAPDEGTAGVELLLTSPLLS